jgi:ribosomal protein S27AE
MSENLDMCPRCKEGEMEEPFASVAMEPNEQSSTTRRICNKCGYKEPYVGLLKI